MLATRKPIVIAVLACILVGCTGLITPGPAPNLYHLTPKSTFPEGLASVSWQRVIEEPIAARGLEARIPLHDQARIVPRDGQQLAMRFQVDQTELRQARLTGAQHIPGTAQAQVLFGDLGAVVRFPQHSEPLAARGADLPAVEEEAGRIPLAAPDPPA